MLKLGNPLRLRSGLGLTPLGARRSVFIPVGLGFDTTSFPIAPKINDPGGLSLATGDAGTTPEAMFDLFSTARSAPVTTYYVGVGGADANNGLSPATKKLSLSNTITTANATGQPAKIVSDGSVEYPRQISFNGVSPTVDLYITTASGRATFGLFEQSSVFTPFAIDATNTNCYSMTLANADRVTNRLAQNAFGWNRDFTNFASAVALNSATLTNDGFVIDTGKIYIRRLDGTAPTYTNTRIYRSAGVNNFKITSAVNIFIENCDGEGGQNGVFDYQMSVKQTVNKVFVAKNCTARYGGGVSSVDCKGFAVNGMKGLAYLYGCDGSANATDGINFHDTVASGQQFLTVNCSGSDNGRGTNQSCNGLTWHEACVGVDLAGNYPNNRGGSVRNAAGASKALCAGTYSTDLGDTGLGGTTTPTCFYFDNGTVVWCDRTKAGLASGSAYNAISGATIHRRNSKTAGASDTGAGTIDTY